MRSSSSTEQYPESIDNGGRAVGYPGGDYAKFYERYQGEYLPRLRRAERSYEQVIADHERWIQDPASKLQPGLSPEEIRRYVEQKWPRDIARNAAYLDIIKGIIGERLK